VLVVTDHDLGFDIHIFQLEVLQEDSQRGSPFSLVDDGDRRVRPTNRLPVGDLACVDRDNLLGRASATPREEPPLCTSLRTAG
jgi:hypothetical protein